MPRPKEKEPMADSVSVRLPRDIYERLERIAEADGRTMGGMVRRIVETCLPQFEKPTQQEQDADEQ